MPAGQIAIPRVEMMPSIPQPFKMRDWRAHAHAYDQFVFDPNLQGEFLPLLWWDDTRINVDRVTFGLPSYVGTPNSKGANHEGITCLGAILGATLAGIDKSKGEHNWVRMCEAYFSRKNGQNLVLNRTSAGTGGSFWYELWPHVLFYAIADRYPQFDSLQQIVKTTADRWYEATVRLGGDRADFNHLSFNFAKMEAADNGRWTEPEGAAGVAWLEYMAWTRWRDPKHLQAADWALGFLNRRARDNGALYEVLMPFGVLAAARMNAEQGRGYDIDKMLHWCFDGTNHPRRGWGIIADRWGEADCHGLQGSITDGGGYAFAMSTFAFPAALVPMVRYDARYARAIGKYVLNAANAARLFYPDEHPADSQSSAFWKGDPLHLIPYEGLRKSWQGKSCVATGDPIAHKWGPKTDLGLYGGSLVGLFGGLIARTHHEAILRLDCLATDFFRNPSYPSYLYYNPYAATKEVEIDLSGVGGASLPRGNKAYDLYDAASNEFLKKVVSGKASFAVPADSAVLLVVAPAGGKVTYDGRKTLVDGVVVDYNNGREPLPAPSRESAGDRPRGRGLNTVRPRSTGWRPWLHAAALRAERTGLISRHSRPDAALRLLRCRQGSSRHEAKPVCLRPRAPHPSLPEFQRGCQGDPLHPVAYRQQ